MGDQRQAQPSRRRNNAGHKSEAQPSSSMADKLPESSTNDHAEAHPYSSMAGKLLAELLKALDVMGYHTMTPVQHKVLTSLPNFRADCLVQAKTGTGKTTAFLLPILSSLSGIVQRGNVSALILSPTRELALQIAAECKQLTKFMKPAPEVHTAFGGTARASNLKAFLNGNPTILVATPGRLKDYLTEEETRHRFRQIQTVVLDEADTMLEQGFLQDVKAILALLPPKKSSPTSINWQGMCFSATIPPKIKSVLDTVLAKDHTHLTTVAPDENLTHDRVPQFHVRISSLVDTIPAMLSLLSLELAAPSSEHKIIVFGTTANLVALYSEVYRHCPLASRFPTFELHSRMSQSARTKTTDAFKAAPSGVLFATDVVGRGMDFPLVTAVIQVGLPMNGEQYVHRIGRTARAEQDGRAVILLTESESYFLRTNPQLDIKPYPQNVQPNMEETQSYLAQVDETTKAKAYSAYLGFMKGFMNKLRMDAPGLVASANQFALEGMGCAEVPAMERSTVGKMGLKGVPGLRLAGPGDGHAGRGPRGPPRNRQPRNDAARDGNTGQGTTNKPDGARKHQRAKGDGNTGDKGKAKKPRRGGGQHGSANGQNPW